MALSDACNEFLGSVTDAMTLDEAGPFIEQFAQAACDYAHPPYDDWYVIGETRALRRRISHLAVAYDAAFPPNAWYKLFVNSVCEKQGDPPRYPEVQKSEAEWEALKATYDCALRDLRELTQGVATYLDQMSEDDDSAVGAEAKRLIAEAMATPQTAKRIDIDIGR